MNGKYFNKVIKKEDKTTLYLGKTSKELI